MQKAIDAYKADLNKEGGGKEIALANAATSFINRQNTVKKSTGPDAGKTGVEVYKERYDAAKTAQLGN